VGDRPVSWLRRRWRVLVAGAAALASLVTLVVGIWLIYTPAGLIATGIAGFAVLTFDPAQARRVTWPR